MTSTDIGNKIYHLTLTALPHYRVKYEQMQFCKNSHFFYLFTVVRKISIVTGYALLLLILIPIQAILPVSAR